MNETIEHEISRLQEESYRKGYAHGFETGIITPSSDVKELREKIRNWRNEDVFSYEGAPGTFMQGKVMGKVSDSKSE